MQVVPLSVGTLNHKSSVKIRITCLNLVTAATKLGQGYVFTRVCHPVHRGGSRSLSPGVSIPGGSLSQGVSDRTLSGGVSVPGGVSRGSLSRRGSLSGDSVPGGLCQGGLCLGGLCLGVSVQGISVQGVSVQGVSVWGSLSRGYLSRVVSVQGVSVLGSLSRGSLSWGSLSWRPLHMVTNGRNASYWNAFLFKYSSFVCSISPVFFRSKKM